MNEIVTIHVGPCGNRVGAKFWEVISDEHGIDPTGAYHGASDLQLERVNVFYREATGDKYIPRAVLVDMKNDSFDDVQSGPFGQMFPPDNFVSGNNSALHNFARGYRTQGARLVDRFLQAVAKEAESCDGLQGFIIFHSLGCGVGSGLGSLLIETLKDEYPDRIIAPVSVFPSEKVSDAVADRMPEQGVEPYNAVLALHTLIENADLTFCIDNEALHNICCAPMSGIGQPSYFTFNALIGQAISSITAPLRFPMPGTDGLSTLRKMAVNLVPFPRLHFLNVGIAPMRVASSGATPTVAELAQQPFEASNLFAAADPRQGKYLAAANILRGHVSATEVDEQMLNTGNNIADCCHEQIFDSVRTVISGIPPRGEKASATSICNTTSIQEVFQRLSGKFSEFFRRKSYLHWYTGEGMAEMEFTEAESNVNDLVFEYQQYRQ